MLERIDPQLRSCHPTVHPRDLVGGACRDFAQALLCKAAARCAHVPPPKMGGSGLIDDVIADPRAATGSGKV